MCCCMPVTRDSRQTEAPPCGGARPSQLLGCHFGLRQKLRPLFIFPFPFSLSVAIARTLFSPAEATNAYHMLW